MENIGDVGNGGGVVELFLGFHVVTVVEVAIVDFIKMPFWGGESPEII